MNRSIPLHKQGFINVREGNGEFCQLRIHWSALNRLPLVAPHEQKGCQLGWTKPPSCVGQSIFDEASKHIWSYLYIQQSNRNGGFSRLISLWKSFSFAWSLHSIHFTKTWSRNARNGSGITLTAPGVYSPFSPVYTMNHYQVTNQLLSFIIIPEIIGSVLWIAGLCHPMLQRNRTNGNFASEASSSKSWSAHVPIFWHSFLAFLWTFYSKASISQVWHPKFRQHQPNV